MIDTPEQRHAALALRLLLDESATPSNGAAVDWRLLFALARRNTVLVRLAARLERAGLGPPAALAAEAARDGARGRTVLALIRQIGEQCVRQGIAHVFPKALQHWPDTGGDLDLLVSSDPSADALMLDGLTASLRARDLRDRLAGTTIYWLPDPGVVLDVQHRRLGIVGEHIAYARALLRERLRRRDVAGHQYMAPAPEDQLILQGMSRVAVRRSFSIADVVATVGLVQDPGLDWRYLVTTARGLGVLPALACYLGYVDQVYRGVYGRGLVPPAAPRDVIRGGWGPVTFRDGRYRFHSIRVRNRLYWRQLATAAGAGRWGVVSRLCLVPAVIVGVSLGVVGREPGPGRAA